MHRFLDHSQVTATVRTIVRFARDGSRERAVLDLTGLASQAVKVEGGGAPDPYLLMQALWDVLTPRFAFAHDPVGQELVQRPTRTLERGAGDCDDWTALVCACARALGQASRAVLVSREAGAKLVAEHVYPDVFVNGEWVSMDYAGGLPFGQVPTFEGEVIREGTMVDAPEAAAGGIGFIDAILGAVGGVVSGIFGSNAAKDNRKAAESSASAIKAQAQATKDAAATTAGAVRAASQDQLAAVKLETDLAAKRLGVDAAAIDQVFDTLERALPALVLLFLVRAAAPVVQTAIEKVAA